MQSQKAQSIRSLWTHQQGNLISDNSIEAQPNFLSKMMANLFCPGPNFFFVIDFGTQEFVYVDPQVQPLLGHHPTAFTLEKFLDDLHSSAVQHVMQCEQKIMDFLLNKVAPSERMDYKFAYAGKRKTADGTYRLFLHQAIVIALDEYHQISRTLSVDTRIDHLVQKDICLLSIIGLNGKPSYLGIDPSRSMDDYLTPVTNLFTHRELEVIRLFADGHTAKEIAAILHLSTGTVRTHRQNVLAKSSCRNMTALVAWCIRQGWV